MSLEIVVSIQRGARGGGAAAVKIFRRRCLWGLCRRGGARGLPAPGHEVVDLRGGMIGQPGKDVGEPGLRVHVVEFAGLDQRQNSGGPASSLVRPDEFPHAAPDRRAAQGALGGVVAEANPSSSPWFPFDRKARSRRCEAAATTFQTRPGQDPDKNRCGATKGRRMGSGNRTCGASRGWWSPSCVFSW